MAEKTTPKKISVTRDYRLSHKDDDNRNLCPKKHKKLAASMKAYGFLMSYPLSCWRDSKGRLRVKDGQHRLAIAETLGLPVYWVEENVDYDIAIVNSTAVTWSIRDYAEKYAENGVKPYVEGLAFVERHGIPCGIGFAILAGVTSFTAIEPEYKSGLFKIKDWPWAEAVASVYGPLCSLSPEIKNARFLQACMRVCRVKTLDIKRLVQGAERCREKLVHYGSIDAYTDMLEEVYNFGRKQLVGLKTEAAMAMRERNPAAKNKVAKA